MNALRVCLHAITLLGVLIVTPMISKAQDVVSSFVPPSFPECNDGQINLTLNGGYEPFVFNWSNGESTQNISNLQNGTYSVTILDDLCGELTLEFNLKCDCDIEIDVVSFQNPSSTSNDPKCDAEYNNSDGSIDISVSPSNVNYTYQWSNGSSNEDLSNLGSGEYEVTVSSEDCWVIESVLLQSCQEYDYISESEACEPIGQPYELNVELVGIQSVYNDDPCSGAIDIEIISQGDVSFNIGYWTGPNGFTSTYTDISNLCEGEYCYHLEDGCNAPMDYCFRVINCDNSSLTLSPSVAPACPNYDVGWLQVLVDGGQPPYTRLWSNGSTSLALQDVPSGIYSVTITDANGCTVASSYTVPSQQTYASGCKVKCGLEIVEDYGPEISVTHPDSCGYINRICTQDPNIIVGTHHVGTSLLLDTETCRLLQVNNVTGDICPDADWLGFHCHTCIFGTNPEDNSELLSCELDFCYYDDLLGGTSIITSIIDHNNPIVTTSVGDSLDNCYFQIYNNCESVSEPVVAETIPCDQTDYINQLSCHNFYPIGIGIPGDLGGCFSPEAPVPPGSISSLISEDLNRVEFDSKRSMQFIEVDEFNPNLYEFSRNQLVVDHSNSCDYIRINFDAQNNVSMTIDVIDETKLKIVRSIPYEAKIGFNSLAILSDVYLHESQGKLRIETNLNGNAFQSQIITYDCSKENSWYTTYPNPFNDYIIIRSYKEKSESDESMIIKLYNINGIVAYKTSISKSQYDGYEAKIALPELEDGIYLLSILENDVEQFRKRLIRLSY